MTPEVIGREDELAALHAFLDRTTDGLRALVLEGEAGIGKSTIWQVGVAAARDRSANVLTSRPAETERTIPNVVLGDLLGGIGPEVLDRLPRPRRQALEAALLLGEGPDVPPDPRALGVAISSILMMLTEAGHVVIAIDDDQWMDSSSAAPLEFALRRHLEQPVLLLLSRRLGAEAATRLEGLPGAHAVETIRIGPLSAGATELLIQQRLGISLRRRTLLKIHEMSGGNAFFALELAHARVVDPDGGSDPEIVVPQSLERLVEKRLSSLDHSVREALLLVAASGRLATDLLEALGVEPVALEPAHAASVTSISDGVISFTHPLLASAIYQGATAGARQAAHRRLAASIEDPVLRARHLALGSAEPEAGLAGQLEAAAKTARRRGLPIAAAELGEHAVRLTPAGATSDRLRRGIAAARAISEGGDGERARVLATELLAGAPPGADRAEGRILLAELHGFAKPELAVSLLVDALADASHLPRLQARIHVALGEAGRFTLGRVWAERHAAESLRLAEQLDDDVLRAAALLLVARFRHEGGNPQAVDLARRAYAIAERQSDRELLRGAGWGLADVLVYSGDTEGTRVWLEEQVAVWGDRDEMVRWELLWSLIWVEFISGRWQAASDHSDAGRAISKEFGSDPPQDHHPPAVIALHRGELGLARRHAEDGLAIAGGQHLPYLHATLAICELWSGNLAAALHRFEEAESKADFRGWVIPTLRWWRDSHIGTRRSRSRR